MFVAFTFRARASERSHPMDSIQIEHEKFFGFSAMAKIKLWWSWRKVTKGEKQKVESAAQHNTEMPIKYNVLHLEMLDTEQAKIVSDRDSKRWTCNEIERKKQYRKHMYASNVYVKCIKSTWHLRFSLSFSLFIHHIVFLHGNNYVGFELFGT